MFLDFVDYKIFRDRGMNKAKKKKLYLDFNFQTLREQHGKNFALEVCLSSLSLGPAGVGEGGGWDWGAAGVTFIPTQ